MGWRRTLAVSAVRVTFSDRRMNDGKTSQGNECATGLWRCARVPRAAVKCAATGTRSGDHLMRTEDNCLRLNPSAFLQISKYVHLGTKEYVHAQAFYFVGFVTTLGFRVRSRLHQISRSYGLLGWANEASDFNGNNFRLCMTTIVSTSFNLSNKFLTAQISVEFFNEKNRIQNVFQCRLF